MLDSVPRSSLGYYHPGPGWNLYPTNGEYTEWAYRAHGSIAFTPELTAGCCDPGSGSYYGFVFPDDSALVERVFRDNLPFARSAIAAAGSPATAVGASGLGPAPQRWEALWPEAWLSLDAAAPQPQFTVKRATGSIEMRTAAADSLMRGGYRTSWRADLRSDTVIAARAAGAGPSAELLMLAGAEAADAGWSGWNLNIDAGKPALMIAVWQWSNYLGEEALAKGIRANISSFTRHHPNVSMTKAKIAGNYANSFLAKTESERLGFQEAIMLDPQGYVAECTGENIFVVRRGKIITPATAPILEGITRHTIHTIAKDLGYGVLEHPISRDQLYAADEVFVCGTAAEVIGLCEIDFRKIGNGKSGKVTREIQNVYHDLIRGKVAKYEGWCEYVDESQAVNIPAKESVSAG